MGSHSHFGKLGSRICSMWLVGNYKLISQRDELQAVIYQSS